MHLLITYDMADDKRRNRLAKGLEGYLVRVQESVFEGVIPDQRYESLLRLIETELDQTEDSVRIYRLCQRCVHTMTITGLGTFVSADRDEIV